MNKEKKREGPLGKLQSNLINKKPQKSELPFTKLKEIHTCSQTIKIWSTGVSRQPQLMYLYMGKSRYSGFWVDVVIFFIDFFQLKDFVFWAFQNHDYIEFTLSPSSGSIYNKRKFQIEFYRLYHNNFASDKFSMGS